MKIDSETISTVLLIQKGQLSVTTEIMCTEYWLAAQMTKPTEEKRE